MAKCLNCSKSVRTKYCNQTCRSRHYRDEMVKLWLAGKHSGMKGKTGTAVWIKEYIINSEGEECSLCGWNEINPASGKVPIELNHIDGNFENNERKNLNLLCPNCHSLTDTYKGANRGNGRHNRMERYHDGKSY